MDSYVLIVWFLVGAVVGSFLNVVIYRLPASKPIFGWHNRSYCPYCKKTLSAGDLIPIISFVVLAGKCRHCKKHISWQYITVELLTAAAFSLAWLAFGWSWMFVSIVLLSVVVIPIVVIDARHKVIPDELSIPFIGIALAAGLLTGFMPWHECLIGGAVGAAFFFAQWALSKGRWVGSGDIRIGAGMGFLLGWKFVFAALIIAYLVGTVYSLGMLVVKKRSLKSTIPFGPFLLLASVVVFLWGPDIVNWYFDLYWKIDTSYLL